MDTTDTVENIAEGITGKKAAAVQSLQFFEGEANSREIRRVGEIPTGSMHHHMTGLVDEGLVEQIGEEHVGRGGSAKKWKLTPRGEAVAEVIVDRELSIEEMSEVVDEFDEFDRRLDRLQSSHREKSEAMEQEIEELKAKYSEVKTALDTVLDFIEKEKEEEF